jgi:hypothetical protein
MSSKLELAFDSGRKREGVTVAGAAAYGDGSGGVVSTRS